MDVTNLILLIVVLIFLVVILSVCIVTYVKVKNLQEGSCAGVPKFEPNSVYTKTMTIPIIGYKLDGKATFNSDNTFTLNFSGDEYKNNKWIYNQDSCSLTISIDPDLQSTLTKYNSGIDNTVQINKQGQLVVNGTIEGIVPIQVMLNKN